MEKVKLVIFRVDNQQFAVKLSVTERIVQMVEIAPLPLSPEYIYGTINYHGDFLPVLNIRKIFLLSKKKIELTDKLIIVTTKNGRLSLWVDSVNEITELDAADIIQPEKTYLKAGFVEGILKLRDEMVFINDLDKVFSPEQIIKLNESLQKKKDSEKRALATAASKTGRKMHNKPLKK